MTAKDELHGAEDRQAFGREVQTARDALVRYVLTSAAADPRGAGLHLNEDILRLVSMAVRDEVAAQVKAGLPSRDELANLSTVQAKAAVDDAAFQFRRGVFEKLDDTLAQLRPAIADAREVDSLRSRKATQDAGAEALKAQTEFLRAEALAARKEIGALAVQLEESVKYLAQRLAERAPSGDPNELPAAPQPFEAERRAQPPAAASQGRSGLDFFSAQDPLKGFTRSWRFDSLVAGGACHE